MDYEESIHAMTLVDSMTLVDPYVVCHNNTHAMTLVVVSKKSKHAMTLVDPYVVCLEEHTCNDTGCGS